VGDDGAELVRHSRGGVDVAKQVPAGTGAQDVSLDHGSPKLPFRDEGPQLGTRRDAAESPHRVHHRIHHASLPSRRGVSSALSTGSRNT
jgi:hypothetical protein